jgi:hypothetical protein
MKRLPVVLLPPHMHEMIVMDDEVSILVRRITDAHSASLYWINTLPNAGNAFYQEGQTAHQESMMTYWKPYAR